MPKQFKLPNIKPWDQKGGLNPKFKKIKDPLVRLAVYIKSEGETCGTRYANMQDEDWLDAAKLEQQILEGKYEEES